VGDIRGRGLLMALELVQERSSKTPFDPALARTRRKDAAAPRPAGLPDGRHHRRPAATTSCWRRPSSSLIANWPITESGRSQSRALTRAEKLRP
jgi:hypothetical protein